MPKEFRLKLIESKESLKLKADARRVAAVKPAAPDHGRQGCFKGTERFAWWSRCSKEITECSRSRVVAANRDLFSMHENWNRGLFRHLGC